MRTRKSLKGAKPTHEVNQKFIFNAISLVFKPY